MNAQEMSRLYGYIRASTDKQIASPETQRQIIEDYAKRLGRTVDRYFIDPATSGKKSLFDREAGKELPLTLKKGDAVIVARLDRLSRSFIGFARILEFWLKHKITMHLCDMPGGVFDPVQPHERNADRHAHSLCQLRAAANQRPHTRRAPGPQDARREVLPLGGVRLALG